ncbi:hypothetical protein DAI22_05g050101 [Oryza sativa Japonica Group]|nr:hypothetical protein DAI22_05g050101 [Oryza sativa Japonica Group]
MVSGFERTGRRLWAGFTYTSTGALEDMRIEYTGNTIRRKLIKRKTSQKIIIDEQHLQNYPTEHQNR